MTSPVFACGHCVDLSLIAAFPFAFYWAAVFFVWSFVIGIPMSLVAAIKKQTLPMYPYRYFLAAVAASMILSPPTMGSVFLPLFIVNLVCLVRMVKSQRQLKKQEITPTGISAFAYRVQAVFLAVCFGLIPVAYIRYAIQRILGQDS